MLNQRSTRIATVIDSYLPGYKAGGPVRSIANMAEHLGNEFEFLIFAADRDLGDTEPYPNIKTGQWQRVGKSQVHYLQPHEMLLWNLATILKKTKYDLLYLNSFFSPITIGVMFLRKLKLLAATPTMVAPRGQFDSGAIGLKRLKKASYIRAAKWTGLYQDVVWHATSLAEVHRIHMFFGSDIRSGRSRVVTAPNLPAPSVDLPAQHKSIPKAVGAANIVFVSRIVRKKNLGFALSQLAHVHGNVKFDIYGPLEDSHYWNECRSIIDELPPNVKVQYLGVLSPAQVIPTIARYHLLFLPTLGENFGHAILEALVAGCPVLISDQTPWLKLADKKAGWDLPLADALGFVSVLDTLLDMNEITFSQWSQGAQELGGKYANDPDLIMATRQLLHSALTAV